MIPFSIEAVRRETGKVVAVARIGENGQAVTEMDGKTENGLAGPFDNISFHVGHKLLNEKFGNLVEPPSLREAKANGDITDGDIAASIPHTYRGYQFVLKV